MQAPHSFGALLAGRMHSNCMRTETGLVLADAIRENKTLQLPKIGEIVTDVRQDSVIQCCRDEARLGQRITLVLEQLLNTAR